MTNQQYLNTLDRISPIRVFQDLQDNENWKGDFTGYMFLNRMINRLDKEIDLTYFMTTQIYKGISHA